MSETGRFELQGICASWRAYNGVMIRPDAVRFDRHTALLVAHEPSIRLGADSSNGRLQMWCDRLGLCFSASLDLAKHSGTLRAVRNRSLCGVSILLPPDRQRHFEGDLEVVDSTGIGEISLCATGTGLDPYAQVWSEFCGVDPDEPLDYWTRDKIEQWRARRPAMNDRKSRPSVGPLSPRIAAHGGRPSPELLRRIDAILAAGRPLARR